MSDLPRIEALGPVDYASTTVPHGYHCGKCGALGVKLWLEYSTFLVNQSLLCAACACVEQTTPGKSYSVSQRDDGHVEVTRIFDAEIEPQLHRVYNWRDANGGDQIGWRIPAVPTEDGETYWGYTSVPLEGCQWWYRLPLTKEASK